MPIVTRDLLHGGAQTYGVMLGAFGLGAVIGALNIATLLGRLGDEFRSGSAWSLWASVSLLLRSAARRC